VLHRLEAEFKAQQSAEATEHTKPARPKKTQ